ncbi:ATP-binding protein [Actinomycetospora chibensis]|uniref:ATP-binding protein n=1 Tax=Actinomycetospora chibensis TaxID=663606 RepID=A0ABV9RJA9_9PSEU|nr:ATP-binding protein [Actinomycetospora chibensis]MDD7923828.1 ATP-binding protein [Actinomycetospora chibensis]
MTTASDPFRHLAVFFHDVDGLVATLAPMLTEALTRGDLVWAAIDDPARGAFERRLGSAADDVVFGEPAQPYSYSGQTTASRRADRLRELTADGRAALVLSDSSTVGGPGPRSSAPDFWSVVDASCNLALSGLPVTLVCLCDATGASEDTERYLYWNHPELFDGSHASPNPRYRTPDQVLASVPAPPAPPLGPPNHLATFEGVTALRGVRKATRRHGEEAGLSDEQVDGLVLAIGELVSNSIEHGPGRGTLAWWTRPGQVVAQIHDTGHMTTTTPGLRRPDVRSVRGRGVWLARQLSDVLHFWTGVDGTHVRLEISAA